MFEGSDNIPRGQIDKIVSRAGGNLNASTSFDQTDYYINLPANQLALALWIESERMMHGKIEEIGLETQRKVVKEERRLRYDNQPYGGLQEEMFKLVYAGTPYAWVPIGSVQYIDQAALDEFREFYHKYYVPNNATLSLAGDFDIDQTKKLIEEYYGPIPAGKDLPERGATAEKQTVLGLARTTITGAKHYGAFPGMPPAAAGPQTLDVKKGNTPLPAALHAWKAPEETAPDAYAVEMLTGILADGRSSRLYRRLVDKEQAAVQATAFPYLLERAGIVGAFAVGNRGVTLEKLDALIDEEVAAVKKDGVTAEEFQKARNQKEAEFSSSYGTMQSRARALAHYHVFFGDTNLVNTELEKYLKVTQDDLKRVANEYLTDNGKAIIHYPVPAPAAAGGK